MGDEVDRLTAFDVNDQRSMADLERVEIFACRELLPTAAVRDRARLLVGQEPWGRDQWERLAEGALDRLTKLSRSRISRDTDRYVYIPGE